MNYCGSLSIRTDGKDLSETKTDDEQICFGFLCYFTSIKWALCQSGLMEKI